MGEGVIGKMEKVLKFRTYLTCDSQCVNAV